ncbi:FmdE family protein [Halarsenatibacter silvermanii]|uniref:Formylmethanofuran dehydrogenase subunit E n=1 Tax=Halarsenatibacter silvermanii TaxID=321763 RepID=A0A1G9S6W7_9FIRM|nr:FmdE family protein [Halarsenatibacter silvermanii]SDM31152.1 formylmethanofuran dehydrogenase subunit E [Halarsenatibacter silvermanii]
MKKYNENENWQGCVEFHGHSCPGLAIGFKAAGLAREELSVTEAEDEEIVCVTENDGCGVDAIQYLLSCTSGKGNLIFRPTAKQAFSFFVRDEEMGIRLVFEEDNLLEREEVTVESILKRSEKELFKCKSPHYRMPERAEIFSTVKCENCGEGAAEYAIRFQEGKPVCLDCFDGYSRLQKENLSDNRF